jgi:hypothetical protein
LDPEPESRAVSVGIAGGFCIFCGESSPLTHALGVGLYNPVTKEEVLEIEDFFRSRGAPVIADVTPYTDPSVREILSGRGYHVTDMNHVLVRAVNRNESFDVPPSVTIRPAEPDEVDLYCQTLMRGFFSREDTNEEELRVGRILFHMTSGIGLLAFVGDEPAGGCGMSARNGVASFYGDATLEKFRRRGAHSAMILDRLRRAAEAGCDVATAGTHPGSTSQRNYQRFGFEVAYSKITMVRP